MAAGGRGLGAGWLVFWFSETISPGAGTAGSAIWRFIRTWERRCSVLDGSRFGERGLLGEAKLMSAQQVDALTALMTVSVPRDGDSRCRPAFKVAAACREMDGCLDGGEGGGPPPLNAFDSSLSDMMFADQNCRGRIGKSNFRLRCWQILRAR